MRARSLFAGVLVFLLMGIETGLAAAQQTVAVHATRQYAVKFVCGPSLESPLQVVRGFYATAINLHNPNLEPLVLGDVPPGVPPVRPVFLAKKVALALPGQRVGPVSQFEFAQLGPDEAMEIDCADIERLAGVPAGQFIKGFVVIVSARSLDVTAVYTARDTAAEVSTIDVEEIFERRIQRTIEAVRR